MVIWDYSIIKFMNLNYHLTIIFTDEETETHKYNVLVEKSRAG